MFNLDDSDTFRDVLCGGKVLGVALNCTLICPESGCRFEIGFFETRAVEMEGDEAFAESDD